MIHRDRFHKHIATALFDREDEMEKYLVVIEEFEATLKKIFELYLEYTEQWILYATPENHRKTALDDEWKFTKLLCPMITGEHALAAKTFSKIVQSLFDGIGDRLVTSADELDSHNDIFEEDATNCESRKWQLLTLCRETQQLFTVEREQCVKIMAFTKSLFRDIEKVDFHRDHNIPELEDEGVCIRHNHHANFMCEEVGEAISDLKSAALKLRERLTSTIQRVQVRV